MKRIPAFVGSTIGQKVLMALTGIVLVGYVVGHMAGNLKIFQGPEKLNHYAEFLREVGDPVFDRGQLLWIVRIGLLAAVGIHIWAAIRLTRTARVARPVGYHRPVHLEDTYASRTMRWGGVIITAFVVYHLLHLTFGSVHGSFVPGDVYANMVSGFQVPAVVAAYTAAAVMLGFHLYHGIWSMMQTLGINHAEINRFRRVIAGMVSGAVVVGFLLPPYAILVGVVQ